MTLRPGRNFSVAGLGVCSVSMNMNPPWPTGPEAPRAPNVKVGQWPSPFNPKKNPVFPLPMRRITGLTRPRAASMIASMNDIPNLQASTLNPTDWLLRVGRLTETADELLGGLCELLVSQGLPLERVGLHGRTLHPQVAGVRILWRRGIGSEETRFGYDVIESGGWETSPLRYVYERGEPLRR